MSLKIYWVISKALFSRFDFLQPLLPVHCVVSYFILLLVVFAGVSQIIYVLLLHPKMLLCPSIHPSLPSPPPSPFFSNGQSGIDIISLEDPSLCQSLFIYSMATGLIMVFLLPSLSHTHSLTLLAFCPSLPLWTLSVSYLRESVLFTNGFYQTQQTPTDFLQALAQVYCNKLENDLKLMLTIHHLLTADSGCVCYAALSSSQLRTACLAPSFLSSSPIPSHHHTAEAVYCCTLFFVLH